jgi:hypothetical protein
MAKTRDAGPKPRNDAYTGLLGISLLALVGGCVLMYLDHDELGKAPSKGELKVDVPGTAAGKGGGLPAKVDPGGLGGGGGAIPVEPTPPDKKEPPKDPPKEKGGL